MQNNYSQMLLNGIQNDKNDIKINDIPLIINTIDTSYLLAFIDYEEKDILGINYTAEDGTERFIVINKEHIIDISILYQQDIDIIIDESTKDDDVMYQ